MILKCSIAQALEETSKHCCFDHSVSLQFFLQMPNWKSKQTKDESFLEQSSLCQSLLPILSDDHRLRWRLQKVNRNDPRFTKGPPSKLYCLKGHRTNCFKIQIKFLSINNFCFYFIFMFYKKQVATKLKICLNAKLQD
jgi:hypothetical protein